MINYRGYRLTNRAVYIESDAEVLVNKVNQKVNLLYRKLEPLSCKNPMAIFGFLAMMKEGFDGQRLRQGLAPSALRLFLTDSDKTA